MLGLQIFLLRCNKKTLWPLFSRNKGHKFFLNYSLFRSLFPLPLFVGMAPLDKEGGAQFVLGNFHQGLFLR